jgi:hypothetical protein
VILTGRLRLTTLPFSCGDGTNRREEVVSVSCDGRFGSGVNFAEGFAGGVIERSRRLPWSRRGPTAQ